MNPLLSVTRRILSLPPIARLPIRVRKGVAAGAWWTLFPSTAYWRGTHEPAVQAALIDLMDWRGKCVWDLGSHFGLFAIGLGRRVGPTGFVAAFEPNPGSFARLQLHVRRNRLPWVHPFQMAASDHAGSERLLIYNEPASASAHLPYDDEIWNELNPSTEVNLRPLDELVQAREIRPPDFIKVDVEGHGHRALAGAIHTLRVCRPMIIMGFHSLPELRGVENLLQPLGYVFEPLSPRSQSDAVGKDFLLRPSRPNNA